MGAARNVITVQYASILGEPVSGKSLAECVPVPNLRKLQAGLSSAELNPFCWEAFVESVHGVCTC